jgi:hypothetical protein
MRWLLSLFVAASVCAHPVRIAYDSKVVDWNYRCSTNALAGWAGNSTIELMASSVWMGAVRAAGQYPTHIHRANLFTGGSYGGTNGCGNSTTVTNIGSPQVPLINDVGGPMDTTTAAQDKWKYASTGSTAGLGSVGTNNTFLNTQTSPFTITGVNASWPNDAHFGFYAMETGTDTGITMGAVDSVFGNCAFTGINNPGFGHTTAFWSTAGFPQNNITNAGWYVATRTSSGAGGVQQYYKNLAGGASSSVAGTPVLITVPIVIFGCNQDLTGFVNPFHQLCGGYALGNGLTATQATNAYNNAWQSFETLLGRQK